MGATGYLGSAVLSRFIGPDSAFQITALSRAEDKVERLNKVSPDTLKAVKGSHQDAEVVEKLASEHDITINCADADDVSIEFELVLNVLKLMYFHSHTVGPHQGNPQGNVQAQGCYWTPTHLDSHLWNRNSCRCESHESGLESHNDAEPLSIKKQDAKGAYPTETIYSDLRANPSAKPPLLYLDSLPPTALHRNVDLAIIEADKNAKIRSFIVLPSTIYGLNKSILAEQEIGNRQSQQVPRLIRASIDRRRSGMVGNGQNIW